MLRIKKEPGHRIEGFPFQRQPGPGERGKQIFDVFLTSRYGPRSLWIE